MIRSLHYDLSRPTPDTIRAVITAHGNTYAHKDDLKRLGFRFCKAVPASESVWDIEITGTHDQVRDAITNISRALPAEKATRNA